MTEPKKYGLILKSKTKAPPVIQKRSIFDDSDDDEDNKATVEKSIKREGAKKQTNKQAQNDIKRALEENPSVFEYDSIYEDMKEKDLQRKTAAYKEKMQAERKPKYIQALMKKAEERKQEQERRQDRRIQKERETEGDEFADKEVFVTASYKKKLLERQEQEAREEQKRKLEEMMDVTKQKDLSGFYRHYLKQAVGEEPVPDASK